MSIAFAAAFIILRFIVINAQVPTGSMKETINENDRLFGFRLAYVFSEPQQGDVIIFKFPDDESKTYIKRVIGTPGDTVKNICRCRICKWRKNLMSHILKNQWQSTLLH